ncbi:MAG: hypothetical protein ABIZ69_00185, partial [Ilumatobacteraceae bacterium]
MANDMKDEPSSEIIEVIDDDADAFSEDASSETAIDKGGRRWVGPVAVAALVGLIGYGVATSTSANDSRRAAAPSTTTTTTKTTTTAAVSTSLPTSIRPPAVPLDQAPTVPYYAADPPREYAIQYANAQQLDNSQPVGDGYQLWAAGDASATTGSWFSVTTYLGASTLNAPNSYRVQSGPLNIAISHTAGGHSITRFSPGQGLGVTITSFGWTDLDLVRLAGAVSTDGRSLSYRDNWFASAYELVASVQPQLVVQSVPAEQITYESAQDPGADVVVTVGKQLRPDEGGTAEDRKTALRFLLDGNTSFEVDGLSAVAGNVVGRDLSMATWTIGDNVITVTAKMPVPQLIGVAQTVHEVSTKVWNGMKFQALRNAGNQPREVDRR